MPTELHDDMASNLRKLGGEFGATTGRPRRIGWFDAIVTRYVTEINGCTGLNITKLDVLDTLSEIPICIAYRYKGELIEHLPDPSIHDKCEPVYEIMPGWQESTENAKTLEDPQQRPHIPRPPGRTCQCTDSQHRHRPQSRPDPHDLEIIDMAECIYTPCHIYLAAIFRSRSSGSGFSQEMKAIRLFQASVVATIGQQSVFSHHEFRRA